MFRMIALALIGAVGLAACAPVTRMNVPRGYTSPPSLQLSAASKTRTVSLPAEGARLYNEGHYRQACKTFERVLAEHPTDYNAAYLLGMSYLKRSRYKDAQESFRLALELGPDRSTASSIYAGMAYSFEAQRQTRRAHQFYHLACKQQKSNSYAQAGAARTEYRNLQRQSRR